MRRLSRPTALKIAAVLSFVLGVWGLIFSMPNLARGADVLEHAADAPPFGVLIIAFVFAIVRIVAAPGIWQLQRWGIVMTLIANGLDALAAAPGLLFAPTIGLKIAALQGIVLGVIVVVLCLWRDPQRANV